MGPHIGESFGIDLDAPGIPHRSKRHNHINNPTSSPQSVTFPFIVCIGR